MTDLSCTWLGLNLRSPLIVGASPLALTAERAREFVDAGAGALVMPSLFEEQLIADQLAAHEFFDSYIDTNAEARSFLPETEVFSVGATPAMDRIRALCDAVAVPIIGSLNGVTPGGWTGFARQLQDAGASAIELNLYDVVTDLDESGEQIEQRQLRVVEDVVAAVSVPVSVKLSPFYASVPNFVSRLESAGACGVVTFNRYFQPDIDLETLDIDRHLVASTSTELPLRLHALAVLSGRTDLSLTCSGGVHSGTDAAKAILCGAHAVQVVSALLTDGADALAQIHRELSAWLDDRGYEQVSQARGATSMANVANPHELERVNYAHLLQSWQPPRHRSPRLRNL